ncbi:MAG: TetR family transcriptional regulator [Puniceicoccaceae bacterium 5H]|nr:MAG: TetR family transcriptional regulator [Puniceicoccaceae bacterium 5H]
MKRDHVLATAERLFYEEGFFGTGVDRVIAEAGVARMTLYKHFKSKDNLVLAVLDRRADAYWAQLEQAVSQARENGHSACRALVAAHGDWLLGEGRHGCLFLKALGEYAAQEPAVTQRVVAEKKRLCDRMEVLLTEEGHAHAPALAVQLMLLLEGATALVPVMEAKGVVTQLRAAASQLLEVRSG